MYQTNTLYTLHNTVCQLNLKNKFLKFYKFKILLNNEITLKIIYKIRKKYKSNNLNAYVY